VAPRARHSGSALVARFDRLRHNDGIATGIVLSVLATVLAALRYRSTPVCYALLVAPNNSRLVGVTPS
jgi:hypothetical protein